MQAVKAIENDAPFLLTRKAAAKRYSLAQRCLDDLYRRDPDFPVIRCGKRVLIHRDRADEYFTRRIGATINVQA